MLGDVFEAFAAALYLEVGLEGMWDVLKPMMLPLMELRATPATVRMSSKRRLIDLCKKAKLKCRFEQRSNYPFDVTVIIHVQGSELGRHTSTSVHHAEMRACMKALAHERLHQLYQAYLQGKEQRIRESKLAAKGERQVLRAQKLEKHRNMGQLRRHIFSQLNALQSGTSEDADLAAFTSVFQ